MMLFLDRKILFSVFFTFRKGILFIKILISSLVLGSSFLLSILTAQASYLREDQMKEADEKSFASLPLEIIKEISDNLCIQDLCSLGQVCKRLKADTEVEEIWYPIYQRQKKELFPFVKSRVLFDVLDRKLITSSKHVVGVLTHIRHPFILEKDLSYPLLKRLINKAFTKNCTYRPLILHRLSLFQKDINSERRYGLEFFLSCPETVNSLYEGQGPFKGWPKYKRFQLLKRRAELGDTEARIYIKSALTWGTLDERPPEIRWQELYEKALIGQENNLSFITDSLMKGNLLGKQHSYDYCLQQLEVLAQKIAHLTEGNVLAQRISQDALAQMLFQPHLSSITLSEQERFQRLKSLAFEGNFMARTYMATCLYRGDLGVHAWSEEERFTLLRDLGKQEIEEKNTSFLSPIILNLIKAIFKGELGQQNVLPAQRFKILQDMAFEENEKQGIGNYLVQLICEGKELNLGNRSKEARIADIEALAEKGLYAAQSCLVDGMIKGYLDPIYKQEPELPLSLTEKERFQRLKQYCHKGYSDALEKRIGILYQGTLGEDKRPTDKRYLKLKKYAIHHEKAQHCLKKVERKGGFIEVENRRLDYLNDPDFRRVTNSFNSLDHFITQHFEQEAKFPLSPPLILHILKDKFKKGDKEAQEWIYQALYVGKYKYQNLSPSERFLMLVKKVNEGQTEAIKWLVRALTLGELDQHKLSLMEQFNYLRAWAFRGDENAKRALMDILPKLPTAQEVDSYFRILQDLIDQGISEAAQSLCEILKLGYFRGQLLPWTKVERFEKIIRLSEEGYEIAQQDVANLLFSYPQTGRGPSEIQSEDLGPLEERLLRLINYGDRGNSYARQRIRHYLYLSSSPSFKETIKKMCLSALLKWYAQGDLSCKATYDQEILWPKKHLKYNPFYYSFFEIFINNSQDSLSLLHYLYHETLSQIMSNDLYLLENR